MDAVNVDRVGALLTLISIMVASLGMIYRYFTATPLEKFLMEGADKAWVAVTEFLVCFFIIEFVQLILATFLNNVGRVVFQNELFKVQGFKETILLTLIIVPNEELSPHKFKNKDIGLGILAGYLIIIIETVCYFKLFDYIGVFKDNGEFHTVGFGVFICTVICVLLKNERLAIAVAYFNTFIFKSGLFKLILNRPEDKGTRDCFDDGIVTGVALSNAIMRIRFVICLLIIMLEALLGYTMQLNAFSIRLGILLLILQVIDKIVRKHRDLYDDFWRMFGIAVLFIVTTPLGLLSAYDHFNGALEILTIIFALLGLFWTMVLNVWIPEKLPEFNKRAIFHVLLKNDEMQYYCYGIKEGYFLCGKEVSQKRQKEFLLIPINEVVAICQGMVVEQNEKDTPNNKSWVCADDTKCNSGHPDILFIDRIDGKSVSGGVKDKNGVLWYQVDEGKHFVHLTASWKQENKCSNQNQSLISDGEIEVELCAGCWYVFKYNINDMIFEINKL